MQLYGNIFCVLRTCSSWEFIHTTTKLCCTMSKWFEGKRSDPNVEEEFAIFWPQQRRCSKYLKLSELKAKTLPVKKRYKYLRESHWAPSINWNLDLNFVGSALFVHVAAEHSWSACVRLPLVSLTYLQSSQKLGRVHASVELREGRERTLWAMRQRREDCNPHRLLRRFHDRILHEAITPKK